MDKIDPKVERVVRALFEKRPWPTAPDEAYPVKTFPRFVYAAGFLLEMFGTVTFFISLVLFVFGFTNPGPIYPFIAICIGLVFDSLSYQVAIRWYPRHNIPFPGPGGESHPS